MLQFSLAVGGLLAKYKKDTHDLAKACKFPEEVIHAWRYGLFGELPAPGHIISLARAFGVSPEDVLENYLSLLYAHLRDDCKGPAAKYINIEILPKALPIVSTARWFPIHRRSELDLEAIRKHIWYDAKLRKTIRDVANPFKYKPVPKSLEETKQESVDNANSGT